MSPTIPILSALLLSLISGSTEGGQRMDSVSLLRQTLRYWRKVYKAYDEEVTLGYCWAGYLLEISIELPTNLSASPPAATCGDRADTTVGTAKSQQNPFPRNAMTDTATPFGITRERRHPREHATARSTIFRFTNDPDEHRVRLARRSEIIQKRMKRTMNKNKRVSLNNYTERSGEIDENERVASTIDSYARRRRRALSIAPELSGDEQTAPRGEFPSRGNSHAVNPTPNPKDDDKVDSGSTDLGEKDSRRKVLRSLTRSHRSSFVEDVYASRSFSLQVAHDGHRFPFRWYSSTEKRNSTRVDEMLSDPRTPREDHGIEGDPAGRRTPLNNDGSSPVPFVRSQFRRVNADAKHRSCEGVVKLMDSEGNSSCEPTINSKTPRRKPEELSRDTLLSPRGGSAIAERSPLESSGSGGEAVKRNALPQFKTVRGSDTKNRRYQQPTEEGSSWDGRDERISATIHPFFSSVFRRSYRRTFYENHGFPPVPIIPQKLRQDDDPIRIKRSAPSLSSTGRFIKDYEDSANQSAQHSKLITLQTSRDQDQLFPVLRSTSGIYSFIVAFFRTLGMFVQVGRQIINAVETNKAFVCTKEYLWTKIIRWIDT